MRLLIVDDDRAIVSAVQASLDWTGIGIEEVRTAYSAEQAKRVLESEEIDIVVSDIEMPGESGLELLEWVREKQLACAFLLLTCHERFDYAARAIHLGAVDYLSKPFDPAVMALSLQRTVEGLQKQRAEIWHARNPRQTEISFWLSLFSGLGSLSEDDLREEIRIKGLNIDPDCPGILAVIRASEFEGAERELQEGLLLYGLDHTVSRHVFGMTENSRVIHRRDGDGIWQVLVTVQPDLQERLEAAAEEVQTTFHTQMTGCLLALDRLSSAPERVTEGKRLIREHVGYYGQFFTEDACRLSPREDAILDEEALAECLDRRDRAAVLNKVKEAVHSRQTMGSLKEHDLYLMHHELMLAVYTFLARHGRSAVALATEETVRELEKHASRSPMDLLRYAAYLTEAAFARDIVTGEESLMDQVEAYLHAHFREDVDRDQLAAQFHLAPDYLTKLYKKEKGRTFKDVIRTYRVDYACALLRETDERVGDIAQAAGYDNFSYFSAVFKKETGRTPQEYRNELEM